MTKDTKEHIAIGAVAAAIVGLVILSGVTLENCNEEIRCESLREQGVRVYVSKGLFKKRCEVYQRDVVGEPIKVR